MKKTVINGKRTTGRRKGIRVRIIAVALGAAAALSAAGICAGCSTGSSRANTGDVSVGEIQKKKAEAELQRRQAKTLTARMDAERKAAQARTEEAVMAAEASTAPAED